MGVPPWHELTPQEARTIGRELAPPAESGPNVERVRSWSLPMSHGGSITLRELVPNGAENAGVIVYFHGGGWIAGDIDEYEAFGRTLATHAGMTVLLVNYRKAPESPYPIPAQDAWESLVWAVDHYQTERGVSVPIVVAGDSAGGNLAAIVCQKAKRIGSPPLAAQVLIYPVLDRDFERESYQDPQMQWDLLLSRKTMEYYWQHYLPCDRQNDWSDALPIREASFEGMPPTVIISAEVDVLNDEAQDYAQRLTKDGASVHHRTLRGQGHGFITFGQDHPAVNEAVTFIAERLNQFIEGEDVASSSPTERKK